MKGSVVIVDDHPRFRRSARLVLELEGYEVVGEAANGAEALAVVDRTRPDVVLLDIALPDLSGFDVAERLAGERLAIVLVSSRDRADLGERVGSCGAVGFIAKNELSGETLAELLEASQ